VIFVVAELIRIQGYKTARIIDAIIVDVRQVTQNTTCMFKYTRIL